MSQRFQIKMKLDIDRSPCVCLVNRPAETPTHLQDALLANLGLFWAILERHGEALSRLDVAPWPSVAAMGAVLGLSRGVLGGVLEDTLSCHEDVPGLSLAIQVVVRRPGPSWSRPAPSGAVLGPG